MRILLHCLMKALRLGGTLVLSFSRQGQSVTTNIRQAIASNCLSGQLTVGKSSFKWKAAQPCSHAVFLQPRTKINATHLCRHPPKSLDERVNRSENEEGAKLQLRAGMEGEERGKRMAESQSSGCEREGKMM